MVVIFYWSCAVDEVVHNASGLVAMRSSFLFHAHLPKDSHVRQHIENRLPESVKIMITGKRYRLWRPKAF